MPEKVVLIIQARMGSSRLPGKSMMPLYGKPLIYRLIQRVKRCNSIDEIFLAIPNTKENDVLTDIAKSLNINIFRGSENDLVDRYFQCAKNANADIVCRLPGDNPVPEPSEIDRAVNFHIKLPVRGFTSNLSQISSSGYPDGIGVEVFDFHYLNEIFLKDKSDMEKEHLHLNFYDYVTEKIYDESWCPVNTPKCPEIFSRPDLILDVNTIDQYQFIADLYEDLYPKNAKFSINEIIKWYDNEHRKN